MPPPIRSKKMPLKLSEEAKEMIEEQEVKESRKRMKMEYREAKMAPPVHPETMGPEQELREAIMRLSLFPNTVSAKSMLKTGTH